jgi:hypothetical protein
MLGRGTGDDLLFPLEGNLEMRDGRDLPGDRCLNFCRVEVILRDISGEMERRPALIALPIRSKTLRVADLERTGDFGGGEATGRCFCSEAGLAPLGEAGAKAGLEKSTALLDLD